MTRQSSKLLTSVVVAMMVTFGVSLGFPRIAFASDPAGWGLAGVVLDDDVEGRHITVAWDDAGGQFVVWLDVPVGD